MSQAIKQTIISAPEISTDIRVKDSGLLSYLPAALALGGALLMLLARIEFGGAHFISDGALMMIALACYLSAAVFHLTNLYAPSNVAQKLGLWLATLGVFCNISSWLVRWVAAHDRELAIFISQGRSAADMPWFFRYIPFANLYDLSLAFAMGAGFTTLLIAHRKNFRFLGALTLPLAALILVLARFIGGEIMNLTPVLDSYWRPIHVGIASLSYGVALVCFAAAVVYLLKDGVKPEAMAIWSSIFGLSVFATISKFSVFTAGVYEASTFLGADKFSLPLRAEIPYVGLLLIIAGLLLIGVIFTFCRYVFKNDERARNIGHWLLKISLVVQAAAIVALVTGIKSITNVLDHVDKARQYPRLGAWVLEKVEGMTPQQIAALNDAQLYRAASDFVAERGSMIHLSLNANPVELSALITVFAATLFVIIFSFKTERLRAALPSAETLDGLMYKTAGVTFAGLALLLMTGAIWANESWGRYWGWDSKETGAFVAWLTYAAFLHARIARGWTGRRSAYFAVVAFLLIIFTYLGVSYLLPGLHSYA
jgi:ABC-type transport system involved in cytochrome c biogenesis permease subunit